MWKTGDRVPLTGGLFPSSLTAIPAKSSVQSGSHSLVGSQKDFTYRGGGYFEKRAQPGERLSRTLLVFFSHPCCPSLVHWSSLPAPVAKLVGLHKPVPFGRCSTLGPCSVDACAPSHPGPLATYWIPVPWNHASVGVNADRTMPYSETRVIPRDLKKKSRQETPNSIGFNLTTGGPEASKDVK